MSKLERFIDNNRGSFDDKEPAAGIWDKIEAALPQKQAKKARITPFFKWSIAAAVTILVAVSVFLSLNKKSGTAPEIVKAPPVDSSVYQVAPDEAPQMVQFARLIETKQEELKVLTKEQPQLYQKFTRDVTQLDSSYNALKKQLSITPNKEMLIEAMIQNLQLQLSVLNQQLNIINQIKNSKSNSNEKNIQFM